jgi:molecular chaperone DnaK
MGKVIGIDLGTTNSVVAVLEAGQPVVITNDEGERKTPSVVAYTKDGERLVGQVAKHQAITNPEQTVYSIKRFMGRRFSEVSDERRYVPYNIVEAPNGEARVDIDGRKLHPPEICAQVLLKLKRAAEDYLREPVTEAVITVPAYFNDAQRQATKDAGTIAGLDVKRILNEPTAAAMAYGLDKRRDQTVAIFDFGGGTFDISILAIGDKVIQVLATNGDTHLGGDNIDDRIVEWLLGEFQQETGIDLRADKIALQRLKDAAEKAKIELSTTLKREINLPFLAVDASGPKHLVRELTRARLEAMIQDLIASTVTPTLTCLADAKLKPADINEVVLVGGSTRIPKVQEVVKELFGKEPNKSVNPDEVVAIGAAVQAGILTGEVRDLLLLDVTPLSLGIETRGGLMTKIIERNTTIPIRETQVFTTTGDGLTEVDIHVLQGERELMRDNRTLGRVLLTGLPPAPRGVPRIEVTFDIDSNGIVNVSAKDMATGAETALQITTAAGLSREDVEAMVEDAQTHEAEDRRRRATVETRNRAENLIYQAETFISANAPRLGGAAEDIRAGIKSLRRSLGGDQPDAVQSGLEHLQGVLYAAGEAMYRAPGARPTARSTSNGEAVPPRAGAAPAPPAPPRQNGTTHAAPPPSAPVTQPPPPPNPFMDAPVGTAPEEIPDPEWPQIDR